MPVFPLYRLSFLLLVFFLWGESVRVLAETKPDVGLSHLEVYLDGTFMYESPGQEA